LYDASKNKSQKDEMICFFFLNMTHLTHHVQSVQVYGWTFPDGLVLKKIAILKYRITILVESQFLIVSAPKYRDSIESGDRCIVPASL